MSGDFQEEIECLGIEASRRKLRRRQPHHAFTHRWPPEGAMLQPFPEQN
jgi:hypothetical protein